ncbi:hypothetical protein LDENG_00162610 [Lucifuga dentata]|nr:hypothetical protein LDENG_00162610 [Lucifuga dentata]
MTSGCHSDWISAAESCQKEGRWSGLKGWSYQKAGLQTYKTVTSTWVSHRPMGAMMRRQGSQPQPNISRE